MDFIIYLTGDMHGDIDRFKDPALRRLKKGDTLIVCGDFGFLWDGSKKEQKQLRWIGKRRYNVLFLEGTHDNLSLLSQYPQTQWNGGTVREISGKLKHLRRGDIFEIEGLRLFVFGGGHSTDMEERLGERMWWQEELPSQEEIDAARNVLSAADNQVDYIITHQGSGKIKHFLSMDSSDYSVLDAFLDEVRESCTYKRWFFGGVHQNKMLPPSEMALFRAVVRIDADKL